MPEKNTGSRFGYSSLSLTEEDRNALLPSRNMLKPIDAAPDAPTPAADAVGVDSRVFNYITDMLRRSGTITAIAEHQGDEGAALVRNVGETGMLYGLAAEFVKGLSKEDQDKLRAGKLEIPTLNKAIQAFDTEVKGGFGRTLRTGFLADIQNAAVTTFNAPASLAMQSEKPMSEVAGAFGKVGETIMEPRRTGQEMAARIEAGEQPTIGEAAASATANVTAPFRAIAQLGQAALGAGAKVVGELGMSSTPILAADIATGGKASEAIKAGARQLLEDQRGVEERNTGRRLSTRPLFSVDPVTGERVTDASAIISGQNIASAVSAELPHQLIAAGTFRLGAAGRTLSATGKATQEMTRIQRSLTRLGAALASPGAKVNAFYNFNRVYNGNINENFTRYKELHPDATDQEAYGKTADAAMLSAFLQTPVNMVSDAIQFGVFDDTVTSLGPNASRIAHALKTAPGNAAKHVLPEGVEEFTEQTIGGTVNKYTFDPEKTWSDVFIEAVESGVQGLQAGGGPGGIRAALGGLTDERQKAKPAQPAQPAQPSGQAQASTIPVKITPSQRTVDDAKTALLKSVLEGQLGESALPVRGISKPAVAAAVAGIGAKFRDIVGSPESLNKLKVDIMSAIEGADPETYAGDDGEALLEAEANKVMFGAADLLTKRVRAAGQSLESREGLDDDGKKEFNKWLGTVDTNKRKDAGALLMELYGITSAEAATAQQQDGKAAAPALDSTKVVDAMKSVAEKVSSVASYLNGSRDERIASVLESGRHNPGAIALYKQKNGIALNEDDNKAIANLGNAINVRKKYDQIRSDLAAQGFGPRMAEAEIDRIMSQEERDLVASIDESRNGVKQISDDLRSGRNDLYGAAFEEVAEQYGPEALTSAVDLSTIDMSKALMLRGVDGDTADKLGATLDQRMGEDGGRNVSLANIREAASIIAEEYGSPAAKLFTSVYTDSLFGERGKLRVADWGKSLTEVGRRAEPGLAQRVASIRNIAQAVPGDTIVDDAGERIGEVIEQGGETVASLDEEQAAESVAAEQEGRRPKVVTQPLAKVVRERPTLKVKSKADGTVAKEVRKSKKPKQKTAGKEAAETMAKIAGGDGVATTPTERVLTGITSFFTQSGQKTRSGRIQGGIDVDGLNGFFMSEAASLGIPVADYVKKHVVPALSDTSALLRDAVAAAFSARAFRGGRKEQSGKLSTNGIIERGVEPVALLLSGKMMTIKAGQTEQSKIEIDPSTPLGIALANDGVRKGKTELEAMAKMVIAEMTGDGHLVAEQVANPRAEGTFYNMYSPGKTPFMVARGATESATAGVAKNSAKDAKPVRVFSLTRNRFQRFVATVRSRDGIVSTHQLPTAPTYDDAVTIAAAKYGKNGNAVTVAESTPTTVKVWSFGKGKDQVAFSARSEGRGGVPIDFLLNSDLIDHKQKILLMLSYFVAPFTGARYSSGSVDRNSIAHGMTKEQFAIMLTLAMQRDGVDDADFLPSIVTEKLSTGGTREVHDYSKLDALVSNLDARLRATFPDMNPITDVVLDEEPGMTVGSGFSARLSSALANAELAEDETGATVSFIRDVANEYGIPTQIAETVIDSIREFGLISGGMDVLNSQAKSGEMRRNEAYLRLASRVNEAMAQLGWDTSVDGNIVHEYEQRYMGGIQTKAGDAPSPSLLPRIREYAGHRAFLNVLASDLEAGTGFNYDSLRSAGASAVASQAASAENVPQFRKKIAEASRKIREIRVTIEKLAGLRDAAERGEKGAASALYAELKMARKPSKGEALTEDMASEVNSRLNAMLREIRSTVVSDIAAVFGARVKGKRGPNSTDLAALVEAGDTARAAAVSELAKAIAAAYDALDASNIKNTRAFRMLRNMVATERVRLHREDAQVIAEQAIASMIEIEGGAVVALASEAAAAAGELSEVREIRMVKDAVESVQGESTPSIDRSRIALDGAAKRLGTIADALDSGRLVFPSDMGSQEAVWIAGNIAAVNKRISAMLAGRIGISATPARDAALEIDRLITGLRGRLVSSTSSSADNTVAGVAASRALGSALAGIASNITGPVPVEVTRRVSEAVDSSAKRIEKIDGPTVDPVEVYGDAIVTPQVKAALDRVRYAKSRLAASLAAASSMGSDVEMTAYERSLVDSLDAAEAKRVVESIMERSDLVAKLSDAHAVAESARKREAAKVAQLSSTSGVDAGVLAAANKALRIASDKARKAKDELDAARGARSADAVLEAVNTWRRGHAEASALLANAVAESGSANPAVAIASQQQQGNPSRELANANKTLSAVIAAAKRIGIDPMADHHVAKNVRRAQSEMHSALIAIERINEMIDEKGRGGKGKRIAVQTSPLAALAILGNPELASFFDLGGVAPVVMSAVVAGAAVYGAYRVAKMIASGDVMKTIGTMTRNGAREVGDVAMRIRRALNWLPANMARLVAKMWDAIMNPDRSPILVGDRVVTRRGETGSAFVDDPTSATNIEGKLKPNGKTLVMKRMEYYLGNPMVALQRIVKHPDSMGGRWYSPDMPHEILYHPGSSTEADTVSRANRDSDARIQGRLFADMVERVVAARGNRFALVLGPNGIGKSSIIQNITSGKHDFVMESAVLNDDTGEVLQTYIDIMKDTAVAAGLEPEVTVYVVTGTTENLSQMPHRNLAAGRAWGIQGVASVWTDGQRAGMRFAKKLMKGGASFVGVNAPSLGESETIYTDAAEFEKVLNKSIPTNEEVVEKLAGATRAILAGLSGPDRLRAGDRDYLTSRLTGLQRSMASTVARQPATRKSAPTVAGTVPVGDLSTVAIEDAMVDRLFKKQTPIDMPGLADDDSFMADMRKLWKEWGLVDTNSAPAVLDPVVYGIAAGIAGVGAAAYVAVRRSMAKAKARALSTTVFTGQRGKGIGAMVNRFSAGFDRTFQQKAHLFTKHPVGMMLNSVVSLLSGERESELLHASPVIKKLMDLRSSNKESMTKVGKVAIARTFWHDVAKTYDTSWMTDEERAMFDQIVAAGVPVAEVFGLNEDESDASDTFMNFFRQQGDRMIEANSNETARELANKQRRVEDARRNSDYDREAELLDEMEELRRAQGRFEDGMRQNRDYVPLVRNSSEEPNGIVEVFIIDGTDDLEADVSDYEQTAFELERAPGKKRLGHSFFDMSSAESRQAAIDRILYQAAMQKWMRDYITSKITGSTSPSLDAYVSDYRKMVESGAITSSHRTLVDDPSKSAQRAALISMGEDRMMAFINNAFGDDNAEAKAAKAKLKNHIRHEMRMSALETATMGRRAVPGAVMDPIEILRQAAFRNGSRISRSNNSHFLQEALDILREAGTMRSGNTKPLDPADVSYLRGYMAEALVPMVEDGWLDKVMSKLRFATFFGTLAMKPSFAAAQAIQGATVSKSYFQIVHGDNARIDNAFRRSWAAAMTMVREVLKPGDTLSAMDEDKLKALIDTAIKKWGIDGLLGDGKNFPRKERSRALRDAIFMAVKQGALIETETAFYTGTDSEFMKAPDDNAVMEWVNGAQKKVTDWTAWFSAKPENMNRIRDYMMASIMALSDGEGGGIYVTLGGEQQGLWPVDNYASKAKFAYRNAAEIGVSEEQADRLVFDEITRSIAGQATHAMDATNFNTSIANREDIFSSKYGSVAKTVLMFVLYPYRVYNSMIAANRIAGRVRPHRSIYARMRPLIRAAMRNMIVGGGLNLPYGMLGLEGLMDLASFAVNLFMSIFDRPTRIHIAKQVKEDMAHALSFGLKLLGAGDDKADQYAERIVKNGITGASVVNVGGQLGIGRTPYAPESPMTPEQSLMERLGGPVGSFFGGFVERASRGQVKEAFVGLAPRMMQAGILKGIELAGGEPMHLSPLTAVGPDLAEASRMTPMEQFAWAMGANPASNAAFADKKAEQREYDNMRRDMTDRRNNALEDGDYEAADRYEAKLEELYDKAFDRGLVVPRTPIPPEPTKRKGSDRKLEQFEKWKGEGLI